MNLSDERDENASGGLGRRPLRYDAPTLDNAEALTGQVVEGFRIDSVLGNGKRSIVYAGEQVSLRRNVALKMLLHEFISDEEHIHDFLEAGRESAGLIHPHVTPIYDVVSAGDLFFIVQERVTGHSLAEAVRGGIILTPEEMIQIGVAATDALRVAHERGGVHGNLHAGNVFIGPEHLVQLSDFAHYTLAPSCVVRSEFDADNTPFLAPEQLRGESPTSRSDIFSLGAILFFAVTGRPPYRVDDLESRLQHPPGVGVPDAMAINPAIPRRVADELTVMLSPDPRQRPPEMKIVDERLSNLLESFERESPYASSSLNNHPDGGLDDPNRRRYKRLRSDMDVSVKAQETASHTRDLLISKLQDFSENGAFVSTSDPLPVGTVVTLDFTLESRAARVHVLGLVRWIHKDPEDPGMGIQFIEVSTSDRCNLREFIDERVINEMVRTFTRTRLHKILLKVIVSSWGRVVSADVLAQATGASHTMLKKALPEFERYGLVRIMHRSIKSIPPASRRVAQALRDALRDDERGGR